MFCEAETNNFLSDLVVYDYFIIVKKGFNLSTDFRDRSFILELYVGVLSRFLKLFRVIISFFEILSSGWMRIFLTSDMRGDSKTFSWSPSSDRWISVFYKSSLGSWNLFSTLNGLSRLLAEKCLLLTRDYLFCRSESYGNLCKNLVTLQK